MFRLSQPVYTYCSFQLLGLAVTEEGALVNWKDSRCTCSTKHRGIGVLRSPLWDWGGSGANQFGNNEGGLGPPVLRTIVTLTVVGGSAFITGFGLRDVIGRAVGRRQRNRTKLSEQKRP